MSIRLCIRLYHYAQYLLYTIQKLYFDNNLCWWGLYLDSGRTYTNSKCNQLVTPDTLWIEMSEKCTCVHACCPEMLPSSGATYTLRMHHFLREKVVPCPVHWLPLEASLFGCSVLCRWSGSSIPSQAALRLMLYLCQQFAEVWDFIYSILNWTFSL